MLKGYWYYWHTGQRLVAVISMILTAVLVGLGMVWLAGFSIWGVVLAVLLDAVGFWVAVIYALVLREYLPQMFIDQVDNLILYQFIIPMIAVFILGRLVTFVVARFFEAQAQSVWLRQTAKGMILVSVVGLGFGLWFYQDQQQAAAEAARLEAEANALSYAKVKLQAGELTDKAINATVIKAAELSVATSEAADQVATKAAELKDNAAQVVSNVAAELSVATSGTTQKTVEQAKQLTDSALASASEAAASAKAATGDAVDAACIKIAKALGKKPEEYCETAVDTPKP